MRPDYEIWIYSRGRYDYANERFDYGIERNTFFIFLFFFSRYWYSGKRVKKFELIVDSESWHME